MFKICAKTVLKINWSEKRRDTRAGKLLSPAYGLLLLYTPESQVIGYSGMYAKLVCPEMQGF